MDGRHYIRGNTMSELINTPFSEYREEQVKANIFDYFVEPSFFDIFCDTKSIIVYGARGTGKTTLLKALSLAETKDTNEYLADKDYIGVYYRVDLNITTAFQGGGLEEEKWSKLFSYYFVSKLCYELVCQMVRVKNDKKMTDESRFCSKYGFLFGGEKTASLEDLREHIYLELAKIRRYINNMSYELYPQIGDYATIIKELPKDLLLELFSKELSNKTIFFLIDEFEGLNEWQQKIVLTFVKYADKYHSFKICMRPDGIKASQTLGDEYIRETDDVRIIDLNDLILENRDDYYKYALYVCQRRYELFCNRINISNSASDGFDKLFETISEENEFEKIFNKYRGEIEKDIKEILQNYSISCVEIEEYLKNNLLDFLILRLLLYKNKSISFNELFESVKKKDKRYDNAIGNYKHALLYYLCLRFQVKKSYSGFKTLVDISGGTMRYLLELCNEVFENALLQRSFDYATPKPISSAIQTKAVVVVSRKRLNQISAVPHIGLNMRTFVIALGSIFRLFHRDDRLAKFEPNHFSIKPTSSLNDEEIQFFLRECVMRGVLLKRKNNKVKNRDQISEDEYIYILHPIYTPVFQISWRSKQKNEFSDEEIRILIGNDSEKINSLIAKYKKNYGGDSWSEDQLQFDFSEDV